MYNRKLTLVILLALVPLGLLTKKYTGTASAWVQDSLGGVLYVVFFALASSIAWPKAAAAKIASTVFLATCGIEVLQLWHPPLLQMARANFFGRTVLGTSFSLLDIAHYAIGAVLSVLLISVLRRTKAKRTQI